MKRYMMIIIEISKNPEWNKARIYYSDDELGLEMHHIVSYESGMKELRQLEKRLGKTAKLVINQFDPSLSHKELSGYLD